MQHVQKNSKERSKNSIDDSKRPVKKEKTKKAVAQALDIRNSLFVTTVVGVWVMKHVAFFGGRERFPLLSTMRAADHCWLCVHLDWIPFRLIDNLRPSNPHPSSTSRYENQSRAFLFVLVQRDVYFLRKEQPSVRRALPPVGWQRTWEQPAQTTTVWACEKTVVMVKQPGHLTSMKKERGPGTSIWVKSDGVCVIDSESRCTHLQLVLAGLGLRGGVEEIDCENLQGTLSVQLFAPISRFGCSEMRRCGRVAGDG